MMPVQNPHQWDRLLDQSDAERTTTLQAFFASLVSLAEEDRQAQIETLVAYEADLSRDAAHAVTRSCFEAWLAMEPQAAQTVVQSYDAVMNRMPGPWAMRRVENALAVAKEMPSEDVARLRAFMPEVLRSAPVIAITPETPPPAEEEREPLPPPVAATAPRRKLAFWRR